MSDLVYYAVIAVILLVAIYGTLVLLIGKRCVGAIRRGASP